MIISMSFRARPGTYLYKGFTLIEVLIVIVILGIIMGVGAVQFREFSKRQALVSAKRQLLADIRSAQADAINGRKPAACTGTLLGYGFRVVQGSPAEYEIFARCSTGASSQDYEIIDGRLPVGISITSPAVNPVIFKPLSHGTNLAEGTWVTVDITNTDIGLTDSLVIRASGEIR